MKEQSSERAQPKYFRSFSALRHPIQPIGPLEFSDARELATYYEAHYEKDDRLVEFVKHLQQEKDGRAEWIVMFTEKYDYWKSGCLKKRTLVIPGQPDQTWTYADNERRWSSYVDNLCGNWFGRRESTALTLRDKAFVLHEQFTELETEVFMSSAAVVRDNQWAFETTSRMIRDLRNLILQIERSASPRICALALGDKEVLKLEGFDEAPPSLFGVVSEWRESQSAFNEEDTVTILPQRDFDLMGQRWAADSKIESITVAPVMAIHNEQPINAFTLFLLMPVELDGEQVAVVNSISRRFALLLQQIIELARLWEESRQDTV